MDLHTWLLKVGLEFKKGFFTRFLDVDNSMEYGENKLNQ